MTASPSESPNPSFKKKLLKALIPAAGIILAIIIGLFLVQRQIPVTEHADAVELSQGVQVPDFDVHPFGEGKVGKISEIPGKVYLLNFWASWCAPCMVEMPSIVKLREAFHERGLVVLPVNLDEEPDEVLPALIKRFKIQFPVYRDPYGHLSDLFNISGIPLTIVLNKDRKILFVETGDRDWNSTEIHQKVEQWLSSK